MPLLSPIGYSLWVNLLIFAIATILVWVGGVRLTRTADSIAVRLGLSRAFVGAILLASATSMPEVATVISASVAGDPNLAIHNITGATALQLTVLGIAGWLTRQRGPLTYFSPDFVLLFIGVGLIAMALTMLAGMSIGPLVTIAGVGIWPLILGVLYIIIMYQARQLQAQPRWTPTDEPSFLAEQQKEEQEYLYPHLTLSQVSAMFAASALLVFVAGWILARVADVIAVQTALGSSFIGVTMLSFATSLPEISATFTAVREARYSLAIGNIFGTGMFNLSLVLVGDLAYRQGNILTKAEPSAMFIIATAALMTCVYLYGLLERRNRTVLGIGVDSAIVILIYIVALIILYFTSTGPV